MQSSDKVENIAILLASWTSGTSGGDVHALQMASEWSQIATVHVVIPEEGRNLVQRFAPQATIHTFKTYKARTSTWGQAVNYIARLTALRALRQQLPKFDIAIAGSHFLPDAVGLQTIRASTKAVYVYHLSSLSARGWGVRSCVAVAAERVSLLLHRRVVDLTFVCNGEIRRKLRNWPRLSMTAVGFDREVWRTSFKSDRLIDLVFCGRLVKTKGVSDFLRVAEHLARAGVVSNVRILGTGPEEGKMQDWIRNRDLQHVIKMEGFVAEHRKREVLAGSKLMIFPSQEEGWGIAVCEALAAGCPVLAYDLPVYGELFDDCIVTCPQGDWEKLAARARALLSDEPLLLEMGTKGQAVVDRYDYKLVARQEMNILREANEMC
jgi:glycosyltransferase involved in cell wall biosynthesis